MAHLRRAGGAMVGRVLTVATHSSRPFAHGPLGSQLSAFTH